MCKDAKRSLVTFQNGIEVRKVFTFTLVQKLEGQGRSKCDGEKLERCENF